VNNKFQIGDVVTYIRDLSFRGRITRVPENRGDNYRMDEIVPSNSLMKIEGQIRLRESVLELVVETGPALVGPKPEPVAGPKHPTPWTSVGRQVKDADGFTVFEVCGPMSTVDEDYRLAQIVSDAVNAKFGVETPATPAGPKTVRYLIDKDGDFWFETEPGEFRMADQGNGEDEPRQAYFEDARRKTRGKDHGGVARMYGIRSEGVFIPTS
jgi:hypothetical protein